MKYQRESRVEHGMETVLLWADGVLSTMSIGG